MSPHYIFKYGETVSLNLDIDNTTGQIITSVVAKIKKAGPNGSVVQANPVLGSFTVIPSVAGYILNYYASLLPVDHYVVDAKITFVSGTSMVTDTLVIKVEPSVS